MELAAAMAQCEIKAMHSKNHDIPLCRWGLCLAGELQKHMEKQLYNEGHGPNPALSSTLQLSKELSFRLQLPRTVQDLALVAALHAAAGGWRQQNGCKPLFPKLGDALRAQPW